MHGCVKCSFIFSAFLFTNLHTAWNLNKEHFWKGNFRPSPSSTERSHPASAKDLARQAFRSSPESHGTKTQVTTGCKTSCSWHRNLIHAEMTAVHGSWTLEGCTIASKEVSFRAKDLPKMSKQPSTLCGILDRFQVRLCA